MTSVQRLDRGEFALGSRVRMSQPKLMSMVWMVTEFQPGRSFSWAARTPGLSSTGEHYLFGGEHGPLTVRLVVRQTGPLAPLTGLFYSGLTRRYMQMEAQGLKARSENSPAISAS